jgi:chitinase
VGSGSAFNFETWQNWASTSSPNKNVKVYVGVPAASDAAGSGYISPSALQTIISSVSSSPNFGGIMMWYVLVHNLLTAKGL